MYMLMFLLLLWSVYDFINAFAFPYQNMNVPMLLMLSFSEFPNYVFRCKGDFVVPD